MSTPFYVSPEQLMKDKSDYARKGIARGRSVLTLAYADGILFVGENPSNALHKISEIYDRIAFAGVGKFSEFDSLRTAGVRLADVKGFTYSREDVDARSLANAYAQSLGNVFTHEMKPMEVEILVAEVGHEDAPDALYHVLYDGSVVDEQGFARERDEAVMAFWGRGANEGFGIGAEGFEVHSYQTLPRAHETQVTFPEASLNSTSLVVIGIGTADSAPPPGEMRLDLRATGPIEVTPVPASFVGCIEAPWDLDPSFYAEQSGTTVFRDGAATAVAPNPVFGWTYVDSDVQAQASLTGPGGSIATAEGARLECLLRGAPAGSYDFEVAEMAGQETQASWALVSVATTMTWPHQC